MKKHILFDSCNGGRCYETALLDTKDRKKETAQWKQDGENRNEELGIRKKVLVAWLNGQLVESSSRVNRRQRIENRKEERGIWSAD